MFHTSLIGYAPRDFPDSFADGCRRWLECLNRVDLPAVRKDFQYPYQPDSDVNLGTQSVYLGAAEAPSVLVLISGTHGIEGFAGTAVQCDLLRRLVSDELKLPENVAFLLIHALNPWGYHTLHRCDHAGIDVNRNFVDFDHPPMENPGYETLQPMLEIRDPVQRDRALEKARMEMGNRDYEMALSGGQYRDPFGPFYGGTEASFSRGVIETLIEDWGLASRQLAVIDVHTGLGPYGYGEVISDHPLDSDGHRTAMDWYGAACTSAEAGTSCSVPKLGLLDYAWHRIMGQRSCFVTLECGTLGTPSLFNVLMEDAWMMQHLDQVAPSTLAAHGQQMRAHFYPTDPWWREAVIFRARQVIQRALAGLSK